MYRYPYGSWMYLTYSMCGCVERDLRIDVIHSFFVYAPTTHHPPSPRQKGKGLSGIFGGTVLANGLRIVGKIPLEGMMRMRMGLGGWYW